MASSDEAGEHELYLALQFADGLAGTTLRGSEVEVDMTPDGQRLDPSFWEWRAEADVVGWLVCCDCYRRRAWTPITTILDRWRRIADPSHEDPQAARFASNHPRL